MVEKRTRLPRGMAEERILRTLRAARSAHGRPLTLAQLRDKTELSRGTVQEVIAKLRKAGRVKTHRQRQRAKGPGLLLVEYMDPRIARP